MHRTDRSGVPPLVPLQRLRRQGALALFGLFPFRLPVARFRLEGELQRFRRHFPHDPSRRGGVRQDHHPQFPFRQNDHLAVEQKGGAGVVRHRAAVADVDVPQPPEHPAEPHAEIQVEGNIRVLRAEHFGDRFGLYYSTVAGLPPCEHHPDETAQVEHARVQPPGGNVAQRRLFRLLPFPVPFRRKGRPVDRRGKGGTGHPQREKELVPDVGGEVAAGHLPDRVPEEGHPEVGVGKYGAGRIRRVFVLEAVGHPGERFGIPCPHPLQVVGRKPRMVGHDGARGDGSGIGETGPDREPGEIVAQGPVDVHPSPLGELHGGGRREELRNGAGPIDRVRRRRDVPRLVGVSEPFRPHHPLVVDQRDAQPRHVPLLHLVADQRRDVLRDLRVIAPSDRFRRVGAPEQPAMQTVSSRIVQRPKARFIYASDSRRISGPANPRRILTDGRSPLHSRHDTDLRRHFPVPHAIHAPHRGTGRVS